MIPLQINKNIAKSCFKIENTCGSVESTYCIIRKKGTNEQILKYPAHDKDMEGRACFFWDDSLYSLCGRYELDIFSGSCCCAKAQIEVNVECVITDQNNVDFNECGC